MKVNLLYPRMPVVSSPANNSFTELLGLKTFRWDWIVSAIVLFFTITAVLNPAWRSKVRNLIMPPYRMVVSVAQSDFSRAGMMFKVLKVKTHEGLYLEVYGPADSTRGGLQPLVASTKLNDVKDGFFTFNGQITNLVIDDIDNDGIQDVLTSSFDSNMVAHLNVYHLDLESGTLQKFETEGNNVSSQN
jgi:hypothetical protein